MMNLTDRGLLATASVLAAACTLAALVPERALAATGADQWHSSATLYVWLPSLDGETSFPPDDAGPSIGVTTEAFLDSLHSVFMGAFEMHKGPWGIATDLVYLDLGESKSQTRDFVLGGGEIPADVNANLRFGMTGWLWTLAASHQVVERDGFSMHVLAGTRMLDLREELHWTFNGNIASLPLTEASGSREEQDTQWDAIVGVKGRADLGAGQHWYVPYYVDVGTGESDLTWQGMLGLGYTFESIEVMGVWRYLDYDLGDSTPIKAISFNGPALAVTLHF